MEFRYRAIDKRRSRSPSPPVPAAAPSTPGFRSADSHGGGSSAQRVGNSAAMLCQPDLLPPVTAAVDADQLRRQALKARIRERILSEQAEHRELELEVFSELLREQEQMLSWTALGRSGRGSDTAVVALSTRTVTAANSSLPFTTPEAHPKENALATAPTKRKSPDRDTRALLAPGSKKQKQNTSTCMVCGITANSEKAMQDHLNGKAHKRKVVAFPELPKLVPETEEAGEEESMSMETLGDYYKPTKFMMATSGGVLSEVTQMNGYILCELCNVRTSDRITMMCHLQGSKHISNGKKKHQRKPLGEAEGTVSATTSAIASAEPEKLVLEDFSVPLPHTVRRLEGFLLCELCDVKAPSMNGMREHLSGKKHKNKANASSDASVNVSTGGKEAAKAQPTGTDTAVISDMAGKVEAPLEKSLQPKLGDDSELKEMTLVPQKEDVATGDSAKNAGTEMMKSSAASAGAQLNNACNSDSLTMEVDGVMHPLSRVDGLLVCLSCNTKAPSETVMQSHLAGKKHKRQMTLAARRNNYLSVLATGADEVQDTSSKSTKADVEAGLVPSAVTQANTAADGEDKAPSLATSMAVDRPAAESQLDTCIVEPSEDCKIIEEAEGEHAAAGPNLDRPATEAQLDTCIVEPAEDCKITEEAEGENATAGSNGSVTQTEESVRANDTTAAPKPIKIQVEGKVFTVMRQENGSLSCEVCDVHGCDKDSMILHLYTRTHWDKASFAEKKEEEQARMAAAAMVDKDGEVIGSMATRVLGD